MGLGLGLGLGARARARARVRGGLALVAPSRDLTLFIDSDILFFIID